MPGVWQRAAAVFPALLFLAQCSGSEAPPADQAVKPRVHLMTSLPLVWGEEASMESILSGEATPAPIYRYWQDQYDITAVDSLESLSKDDPDIVILAQPRAMDPADLATLDAWVRRGGDVLILTDPDLVWPSDLPFADPRRPLASGLLSPLLGHWGLEMVAATEGRAAVEKLRVGQHAVTTRGVGKLLPAASGNADADCTADVTGAIVRCNIGQGKASIVADADFLNASSWPEPARRSPRVSAAGRLIDFLVQDLLDSRDDRE